MNSARWIAREGSVRAWLRDAANRTPIRQAFGMEQPMIPDHIVALALVIAIGWILYRWGALIFMGYALYHFWLGEYFFAAFAFAVAWFIEAVKAPALFLARLEGQRWPRI